MNRLTTITLAVLLLAPLAGLSAADGLVVYPPVPGLAASEHYKVRVRSASDGSEWQSAFAWETICKAVDKNAVRYFDTLAGWTHTYVNFETAGAVEIEIARVNGQPIHTAAVHPLRKASACFIKDGKVLVRLDKPCLVAVDIDGQMDGQDTGKGYKGPPIHTISLFANPPLVGKPTPNAPGVLTVKPGETPPSDGPWTTLYFLPGVHDVGLAFPLRANRQYYIPGDALVYGTLGNRKMGDAHHIRIFGLGTLSGSRLNEQNRPIEVMGATDTRVEGITLADSASHSLMLVNSYKAGHPNEVRWTKIFTWRANGDGINPFGNTLIEDCFIRTQDDSLYVNGLGIRRTVLWNDANGSSFVLTATPQLADRQLVVEDCDVIYARAKWHHWSGGRVFNMRGEGGRAGGAGVIFRNINIEDPRPTLQQFFICMTMPEPYAKNGKKRAAGDLSGILFQNISIAAPSVLGEPQILWGQADARIRNLTFENLTLAGKPVRDSEFFKTNEFVDGLIFAANSQPKPAFDAFIRVAKEPPTVSHDLTAMHDATRVLVNPHKGWYHHYPDNHINKYEIARDADLLEFPGMDHLYIRLAWAYLEPKEGKYDWALIDRIIEKWTAQNLGIAFRISCKETSTDRIEQQYATPRWVKEAGAKGGYYRMGNTVGPEAPWEPQYDDPVFLEKLERFLAAFAARYDGQPWLRYVDIGSIGDWGEGHCWAGSRKTLSFAVRKLHVDLHLKYFKHTQLVISDDYVHDLNDPTERARLHQYILTNGISYRDDSIMVNGNFSGWGDHFTVRSPEFFADAYRLTPTVLELEHYGKVKQLGNWEARPGSAAFEFCRGKTGPDFFRGAIDLLHATYIGYHGYAREWLEENPALTRELLNRCGYWLFPVSLELPSTVAAGSVAPFRVAIDNRGVAPPYHPYELRVRLSGGGVSWAGVLGRTDRSWLPGAPIIVQNQLALPADLKSGRYTVSLGLFDGSSGKDRPVEFALQATLRDPEGYYRVAEVEVSSTAQPKR